MLYEKGFALEQKPFAMGVRIEHPQEMVNVSQYGEAADQLPAADYRLTYTTTKGRGVYTFCMCPGGYVVAAASEEGRLAVNGMSEHARDGQNANSALLVQVFPEDFGSEHPLAGMYFQRCLLYTSLLAKIDPRKQNYERFADAYFGTRIILLVFMIVMMSITLTESLYPGLLQVGRVVCAMVAVRCV